MRVLALFVSLVAVHASMEMGKPQQNTTITTGTGTNTGTSDGSKTDKTASVVQQGASSVVGTTTGGAVGGTTKSSAATGSSSTGAASTRSTTTTTGAATGTGPTKSGPASGSTTSGAATGTTSTGAASTGSTTTTTGATTGTGPTKSGPASGTTTTGAASGSGSTTTGAASGTTTTGAATGTGPTKSGPASGTTTTGAASGTGTTSTGAAVTDLETKLINQFVSNYRANFDKYSASANEAARKLHLAIDAAKFGVHPDVSFRAKTPDSLNQKLFDRAIKKDYKTIDDVAGDIADLIGIRITVYLPSIDLVVVEKILNSTFDMREWRRGGAGTGNTSYNGNNYRAVIDNVAVEIQSRGAFAHAFWQIDHAYKYKPKSGKALTPVQSEAFNKLQNAVTAADNALAAFVATLDAPRFAGHHSHGGEEAEISSQSDLNNEAEGANDAEEWQSLPRRYPSNSHTESDQLISDAAEVALSRLRARLGKSRAAAVREQNQVMLDA